MQHSPPRGQHVRAPQRQRHLRRLRGLKRQPADHLPLAGPAIAVPTPGMRTPTNRLGLEELARAVDRHRALHRRPRHPVRDRHLGLIAPVLDGHHERRPQPGRRAHPGWHLGDLLGERLPQTGQRAAPPTPLAPLRRDLPAPAGNVAGGSAPTPCPTSTASDSPGSARRPDHRVTSCTTRTPSPVSTTRSTARPSSPNKHDAASLRSATARGSPFAAPEQRGSRSHGPPTFRRAGPAQPQVARSRVEKPV
ncbi:MAG: hypothetical protein QOG20_4167 [Pseudonocardiales bacterium]|jgi:hypothetical protein|nr:hypothetical protein [Pseudonocardiales bacterium]